MSVNLRYPNITSGTEKEQLVQIKSYLHQLVEQLNYALPTLGTGDGSSQQPSSYEVQGGEMSYYELRSLIIHELQEVEVLFDKLTAEIHTELEASLTEAKASGEFDGPPGPPGADGADGQDGKDGKDGKSPTVTVTDIPGGHRVTITDASSTQSFDVKDGVNGLGFKLDDGTNLY